MGIAASVATWAWTCVVAPLRFFNVCGDLRVGLCVIHMNNVTTINVIQVDNNMNIRELGHTMIIQKGNMR